MSSFVLIERKILYKIQVKVAVSSSGHVYTTLVAVSKATNALFLFFLAYHKHGLNSNKEWIASTIFLFAKLILFLNSYIFFVFLNNLRNKYA